MDTPNLALLSGVLYLVVEAIRIWLVDDKLVKTIALALSLAGAVALSWPLADATAWIVAVQLALLATFTATGVSSVVTSAFQLFGSKSAPAQVAGVAPIGPPVRGRRWPRRW